MKKGRIRTKEKAKRARRRSGWRHYLLLFIVLIALWLSLGRYFGNQAEQAFNVYLQSHTEVLGEKLIRFELLNYRKKLMGALGATAQLRLSSDIPVVAELIGEVRITAQLLNGPIFITKQGVSTGSSRWVFKVDEANSSESDLENLRVLFPKAFPRVTVRTDFNYQAHYFSRLETRFAKLVLSGLYQFETDEQQENNHGSIQIENLQLGVSAQTIQAENISISYQQYGQAVSAGYKPGLTALRSPALIINHPYLKQAVEVSVVAKSDLSIDEGFLKGFVQLDLKQQKNTELPFDTAKLHLRFSGLSAAGVMAVSDAKAELDNLKQQINWTLEDMGEYPEGRDEIIRLNDNIQLAQKGLNTELLKKVFQGKDSVFEAEISSQQAANESKVTAGLVNAGEDNVSAQVNGQLSEAWQVALSTLVKKMGKSEKIVVNKKFKLDLKKAMLLLK